MPDQPAARRAARDRPATPRGGAGTPADRPPGGDSDQPTLVGASAAPEDEAGATWPGTHRQLASRYQLEEPIASGGAAIVWRAYDDVLSRSVAIKVLHPHLARDPGTVERFRREAVNAARLTHPNVVAIYDTGQEQDIVYLVMEHIDGPSLKDILSEHGPLDPAVVAALGEQVASALGEAHAQGVVHRDVKPANILLTGDGVAKVTDFGIAKALTASEATLTGPGTVIGTAAYVAPEQLEGGEVDARADVYALGVVLYECLTGQPAFQGDTPTATAAARLARDLLPPRQVRADVPRALDQIVVRATRRDVDLRFADGNAMARAFAPLVRSQPSEVTALLFGTSAHDMPAVVDLRQITPPPPEAPTPRWPFPPAARRAGAVVAAAAVLLLAGLIAVQTLRDGPSAAPSPPPRTGTALEIVAAGDFDPFGDPPTEHPEAVGNAHDGDPSTAWTTEQYRRSSTFGELKPGVGIWFDLGAPRRVGTVALTLVRAGISVELYARPALPDPVDGLPGWGRPVASFETLPASADLVLPQQPEARFWLIWITDLAALGDGRFQAGLAEIRFLAP